tara:strand:- start:89 stop:307 length:219 start_codon:yes stop_codon:yes gene_type:complete
MKRKTLDRILKYFREEMTANPPGGQGGYSSTPAKAGVDGFDTVMTKKPLRRKKIIGLGPGSRKRWMKKDESK